MKFLSAKWIKLSIEPHNPIDDGAINRGVVFLATRDSRGELTMAGDDDIPSSTLKELIMAISEST